MPLTNAQKQARYRERRNSWPRTDAQMRRLLSVAYWLGRLEEHQQRKTELHWPQIERRLLDAYMEQEGAIEEAGADIEQLIIDYNE